MVYFVIIDRRPVIQTEILRIKSPDLLVEAVLLRSDVNATVSTPYKIFITPVGSKLKNEDELFRADHVEGLKINWLKNKLLEVRFDKARIFRFSNFWDSREIQNFKYIVELKLAPNLATSL